MDDLRQRRICRAKQAVIQRGNTPWTREQEKQLSDLYSQGLTYPEIARIIGRSHDSTKGRGYLLCLHHEFPKRHLFTSEEDKYLKANYGLLPVSQIAASLGLKCSQIHNRANRLGISSEHRYSNQNHNFSSIPDEDIELIRQLHDEGLPQNLIAKKMEVNISTVSKVVNYQSRIG